jgi:hypothetical protein
MVEENKQVQALAVIIVIVGIAFSLGTVVFINPLEEGIRINNAYFTDLNGNNRADTLKIIIKNNSIFKITINEILLLKFYNELNWTYNESISILTNEKSTIICRSGSFSEELLFNEIVQLKIKYQDRQISTYIRIGIEFSDLPFIYGNNFQKNLDYESWTHFFFKNLTGYPMHGEYASLGDWQRRRDPIEFDRCLRCTSRNCQFFILNNSLFNFNNYNLSVDVYREDNDGIGIILRYQIINNLPEFYLLWHTSDHPMGDLEYIEEEAHMYNWSTKNDTVGFSEITLHHVKGYDAGNGIIGFNWTKLNSTYCDIEEEKWYNWRVVLDGNNFKFYFKLNELLTFDNLTLTSGSIGFVSFESRDSCYDNLYIW